MARWRLTQSHYLNLVNQDEICSWEYKETDRTTGRTNRKIYKVPCLLDPGDRTYHNYPDDIIVAHEGTKFGKDYVFSGEPTPDMEPLDDEAQAISDACRHKWVHPIESLPGQSYADARMNEWMKDLTQLMTQAGGVGSAVPAAAISATDFAALQKQVADLTALLAAKEAAPARRV